MSGLRSAIGFLTILPLAPLNAPSSLASARGWFPLVGLLLGGLLVIIEFLVMLLFGAELRSASQGWASYHAIPVFPFLLWPIMLVVVLVVLTRALHLDGFMDSCDALLGGFSRERRLAILRDPHVGAFAVVGVVCLLLVKVTVLLGLPAASAERMPVLLLFPCLSRWAMLLTMELYPYARENGLGTSFFSGEPGIRWQLILGFAFTLIACVALAGIIGIILLAAASAVAWGLGTWSSRLLGGTTGDIYGAVNEVTEVVVLLVAMLLIADSPVLRFAPLPEALGSGLP